jgi:hypothetical protein
MTATLTIDDARLLFPVGTRVEFQDPSVQYEEFLVDDTVVGEPYPAGDIVKVPTKSYGGIAADALGFTIEDVRDMVREIVRLRAELNAARASTVTS